MNRMFRSFRALNHQTFLAVWIATLLSNIGTWMENVGQGWVVATETHSAFRVGLLSFSQFAAVTMLAIPAGIFADIFDRKKIIISAQIAMCLLATLLAVLAHMGLATANVITTIAFFQGAAWVFNGPAWQAVIPHLVPRKDLESAINLNSIQYNIARLIGPAVAGFVVAHWGFQYAFDLNAISFFAVFAAILFIDFDPKLIRQNQKWTKGAFTQAGKWVWNHSGAKRIVISISLFAILSAPIQGLMPYLASDVLMVGPKGLGTMLACLGAGAVFGAFVLGQLPSYYPRHHLIPLSLTFLGIMMAIYSKASVQIIYPVIFIMGIFWLWTMISCNTAMQLLVPDNIRGRVMSILILAHVGMLPIGNLLGGIVAHSIGPRTTLFISSILLIFVGLYTLWQRVPMIDGYEAKGHPIHFKNFLSEVILASSHRAEALSLDRTTENLNKPPKKN
ncbi:MAG: MFS transporter [Oligoflexia bacterium]|nr:MFS transporter [Oligoflexia bacterium]